jgi:hypothetical protein
MLGSSDSPDTWRLEIPAGAAGSYRLAQLDDYAHLRRDSFPWQPPLELSLEGRASAPGLPGTWGFGLWNDPFSFSLGFGGGRRIPALPDCAWFFFASPENYLTLRDDLPAHGALAATFRSVRPPAPLLAAAGLLAPLMFLQPFAPFLRMAARRFVRQAAVALSLDASAWHAYRIVWQAGGVSFAVDGKAVLDTPVSPGGPLGLVLWIDNQYAALPPSGGLRWGALANPQPAWVEVRSLSIRSPG